MSSISTIRCRHCQQWLLLLIIWFSEISFVKCALNKSEATKSKKRVEKLEEWLLYQNIDNHKPSFLFLLISIQSVYFFFNRYTIIIAFRDVYRRIICITETIFVFFWVQLESSDIVVSRHWTLATTRKTPVFGVSEHLSLAQTIRF